MKHPTAESFLQNVAGHELIVLKNDGVYRHLKFAKPGTSNQHFDIVTWPGFLCFCGDMGTYTFSRLIDMFEFFREAPERKEMYINKGYWAEKAFFHSKDIKKFDPALAQEFVDEAIKEWSSDMTDEELSELEWEVGELQDSVDDEHAFYAVAGQFDAKIGEKELKLNDLWETSFTDYTYRFVWCCYALSWGIARFDEWAAQQAVAEATQ